MMNRRDLLSVIAGAVALVASPAKAEEPFQFKVDVWYRVRIRIYQDTACLYVDGNPVPVLVNRDLGRWASQGANVSFTVRHRDKTHTLAEWWRETLIKIDTTFPTAWPIRTTLSKERR